MARARILLAAVLVLPRLVFACDPLPAGSPFDGLCAVVTGRCTVAPHIAILSAFPAEQSLLRSTMEISERLEVAGHQVLVGRLAGQRVLLSLTGIGLVNAAATTTALLARFDLSAIVFSGVAGSGLRIGDVAVPATWTDIATARSFGVDADLLAAAQAVSASDLVLNRCTPVPPDPPGPEVCVGFAPRVVVGGRGESSDPFSGPVPCSPGGGEVLGCEVPLLASAVTVTAAAEDGPADATDEETAAVAELAAAHGVPFLAARGVSDGTDDPLGLPGFPQQFFAYYRLAADNAAAVVMRLLATLPPTDAPAARHGRVRSRPTAACAFERATAPACEGAAAPGRVAKLVARACALRFRAGEAHAAHVERLVRQAARRWRRAAALVEHAHLPSCCADALAGRLRAAEAAVSMPVGTSRAP